MVFVVSISANIYQKNKKSPPLVAMSRMRKLAGAVAHLVTGAHLKVSAAGAMSKTGLHQSFCYWDAHGCSSNHTRRLLLNTLVFWAEVCGNSKLKFYSRKSDRSVDPKKVKVKRLSKNDTPKKIGEGNCFCCHLIGKTGRTIEVNWWHPKGNTNFLRFHTPFCYFCCTNFPPGAPAQASKDDNASPGGPTGRSKINWLVGGSWYQDPGPLTTGFLASGKTNQSQLKKGEMWNSLFTSSLHWTMIGIRMTSFFVLNIRFITRKSAGCHPHLFHHQTSCRANKVTSNSHQGPYCEGSKERTTLTYHGRSTGFFR